MTIDYDNLASGLNSTAIHLLRRLRLQDARLGIGPARLSALSVLVFRAPCSLGQLAEAEQVTSATMSKIVSGLVQSGLVKRQQSAEDARAVRISATRKGRTLMKRGQRARILDLSARLENLDPTEISCLQGAVAILRSMETT